MENVIEIITSLAGAAPYILIGICISSIILLVAKNKIEFPASRIWILWTCLIVSGSMLLGAGIVECYKNYLEKQKNDKRIETLRNLTPKEKEVLRPYIEKESKSQYVENIRFRGEIVSLERAKIIYFAGAHGLYRIYNIEPWAFTYLTEHPELLE
jgi:hypothetical protein